VLLCYEFCWIRENVKVQSELLRHSNIGTTLDLYTQAVSDQKRAAHGQATSSWPIDRLPSMGTDSTVASSRLRR
jgi:hypothetical protein